MPTATEIAPTSTHVRTSVIRRFWWLIPIVAIPILVVVITIAIPDKNNNTETDNSNPDQSQENTEEDVTEQSYGKYFDPDVPDCPTDLSGVLDYPLMPPEAILNLIPLGNINPPGHTAPVDHIYFDSLVEDKIPLYAPADATITNIAEELVQSASGEYVITGHGITFLICKGLVLDLSSYTEISQRLQEEISTIEGQCKYGTIKAGHEQVIGGCSYDTHIKVTSGELLGYVQKTAQVFPFEVWATNYNLQPRADVNWDYYHDDRYAHAICLFDLYEGELRDQFYSKFGTYLSQRTETVNGKTTIIPENFAPRTIEPVCGEVIQDLVGTIQGFWFDGSPEEDRQLGGISFVHYNLDPSIGIIGIGGTLMSTPAIIMYLPKHTGTVNREPSEITADDTVYCYYDDYPPPGRASTSRIEGKVLVQLISDHLMNVEYQDETCGSNEAFTDPFEYQR
jgi:hypothetical protein